MVRIFSAAAAVAADGPPLYARNVSAPSADWVGFGAGEAPRFQANAARQDVPWSELVRFGRMRSVQLRANQVLVVLRSGGRIVGRIAAWSAEAVALDSAPLGRVDLPRAEIAAVWFRLPFDPIRRDDRLETLAAEADAEDVVHLADGDRRTGRTVGWEEPPPADPTVTESRLVLAVDEDRLRLPASALEAVRFADPKGRASGATGPAIWVGLNDGSTFPCRAVRPLPAEATALDPLFVGPAAPTPWTLVSRARVVYLQPLGLGTRYVSDLPAGKDRVVPLLTQAWPARLDRNALGHRLRAAGAEHLKGLGLSGGSALSRPLDGKFRKFEALAVLDDEAGPGGSVSLRILVDGKPAYSGDVLRGGAGAAPLSVDVTGGRLLTIVVLYADRGPVLDYLDLLDARLTE